MKVIELMRTLQGNENIEIADYPNGIKHCSCTTKNIPEELQNREIVTIRLQPNTYLELKLYIA